MKCVPLRILLAMHARALERREENLKQARLHLRRMLERGKEQFDKRNKTRPDVFEPGMLVMAHDTFCQRTGSPTDGKRML